MQRISQKILVIPQRVSRSRSEGFNPGHLRRARRKPRPIRTSTRPRDAARPGQGLPTARGSSPGRPADGAVELDCVVGHAGAADEDSVNGSGTRWPSTMALVSTALTSPGPAGQNSRLSKAPRLRRSVYSLHRRRPARRARSQREPAPGLAGDVLDAVAAGQRLGPVRRRRPAHPQYMKGLGEPHTCPAVRLRARYTPATGKGLGLVGVRHAISAGPPEARAALPCHTQTEPGPSRFAVSGHRRRIPAPRCPSSGPQVRPTDGPRVR